MSNMYCTIVFTESNNFGSVNSTFYETSKNYFIRMFVQQGPPEKCKILKNISHILLTVILSQITSL